MAEGKNSFLLYTDHKELWLKVSDEQAGKIMKMIIRYVTDENPEAPDEITELLFLQFKQHLKRDLKKWEIYRKKQSENGKKGGRPPKPTETQKTQPFKKEPKKAANVNANENANDNSTSYTEKEFLEDWNRLRVEHLKKPSFLNSMSREEAGNFEDLKKQYSREHIQQALIGLFKQKKMPNDNSTMQSNPKHFLSYFNSYLTAYHDKNTSLYGKPELEKTM